MLEGKKIILTPITRDDLAPSRHWVNNRELNRLMLRVLPVTDLDHQRWFEAICSDPSKLVMAVNWKIDHKYIGNTGLYHIDYIHRRAEFWCLIGEPAYWGRGIGKDVLSLMVDYGFNSLNLHKIYLHVNAENERALRLYTSFGFHRNGCLPDHVYLEGRYHDVTVMSLLKEDRER